jgi:poly-gamma-glutamate synthesis protein (capsule biosynthesis protein)
MTDSSIVLVAVGDILVHRDDPPSLFAHARDELRAAHLSLGHCEGAPSNKGSKGSSGPRGTAPRDPRSQAAIADAGFDVVSLASNHVGDWGVDGLIDCLEQFRRVGVVPIGAGENIAKAESQRSATAAASPLRSRQCSVAPEVTTPAAAAGCANAGDHTTTSRSKQTSRGIQRHHDIPAGR